MFKCVLTDSKMIRSVVDAIAILVDEGTFIANASGITLSEMDPGKVGLVLINIPAKAFQEYECKAETIFRLDINELKKIVYRAGSTDSISMTFDGEENKYLIQILGKGTRTFSLGPRDAGENRTKVPQIPFKATIRLASDAISQAVKDVALFAENITFTSNKDQLTITGAGNVGEVEVVFKPSDEETVLSYEVKEDARSTYALSYLNDMVKASGSARTVTIH